MSRLVKRVRRAYRRWLDRKVWAAWCADPVPEPSRATVDARIWRSWTAG